MIQVINYDKNLTVKQELNLRVKNNYKYIESFTKYLSKKGIDINNTFFEVYSSLEKYRTYAYSLLPKEVNKVEYIKLSDLIYITKYPLVRLYQFVLDYYGTESGTRITQSYIDRYTIECNAVKSDNLDFLLIPDETRSYPTEGFNIIISKGKIASKISKCLWHDVFRGKDLDYEAYLACCYPDFAGLEVKNPSFRFTRTKCLMLNDNYCDPCSCDLDFTKDIKHPDVDELLREML